jgi:hypothetical protein
MQCIVTCASGMYICICGYVTSVLRYKFVIFDTCHPDTLHLRQQGCEGPRLFFQAKRVPQGKRVGEALLKTLEVITLQYIVTSSFGYPSKQL